ncbi:MAG TPA: nucleoside monophosphate kinase [Verrucomicrobiae bacterium]|nr:nucleoside monophosphate kinase [Verrucomicrobiae bacterium]
MTVATVTDAEKWQIIVRWLGSGSVNVFGRPLAGKDTQAAAIATHVNGAQLSGGDILRKAAHPDVLAEIDKGLLLTQARFLEIVTPFLQKEEYDQRPLVLSSVGRWDGEQQSILKATEASGHPMKAVILLELSEEQSRTRLSAIQTQGHGARGQRADDHHAALDIRLSEFANKTMPVIEYYAKLGLLIRVDASQLQDAVTAEIRDALFTQATSTTESK